MELKVKKFSGKIIKKGSGQSTYYLDQLSTDIIWVGSNSMTKYLRSKYNLTPEQYYNLVIYGDKDYIERCKYCNEPKGNWWKLSYGYRGEFCCHSCARSYHISHPEEYPDVQVQVEEFNKLGVLNPGWDQPWSNTKKARTQFINKGSITDICRLYIAWTENYELKFGITSDTLINRSYHNNINGGGLYKSIHLLYEDTRVRIANLEAMLKYEFNHSEIIPHSRLREFLTKLKIFITSFDLNDYSERKYL